MNKPLYLRTKLRNDVERLNREAQMHKDAWLLAFGLFIAIAAWLIARFV